MSETTQQRRARQKAEVDKAIKPYFEMWLDDLRENGMSRELPMPPVNEELRVSSAFGNRNVGKANGGVASSTHRAIDLTTVVSPKGRDVNVNTATAGRVLYAGTPDDESGISVIIGGANGTLYSYAHGEKGSLKVKAGDTVFRGQPLMRMGDTGVTTAKCLHIAERMLPLHADGLPKSDFEDWSWQKSKGNDHKFVPAREVQKALDGLEDALGHRITFRDMERTEPRTLWKKDPDKGDRVRAAMVADLNPEYFDNLRMARDAMPAGPMRMALDHAVKASAKPLSDKDVQLPVTAMVKTKPKAAPQSASKKAKDDDWTFAGVASDMVDLAGDVMGLFGSPPAKASTPKPPAKHR